MDVNKITDGHVEVRTCCWLLVVATARACRWVEEVTYSTIVVILALAFTCFIVPVHANSTRLSEAFTI